MLNLETSVSLIAGFVYGIFYTQLENNKLNLEEVTQYRYMDWAITTPMLLLVLLLFLNYKSKRNVHFLFYLVIVALDYVMLTAGYLGETKQANPKITGAVGFIAFGLMISLIYCTTLYGSVESVESVVGIIVFAVFTLVWGLYGVAFYLEVHAKNIMYNTLDVISKAMFGIFIWLYYGRVVVFP